MRSGLRRGALVGAMVWMALAFASLAPRVHLGIIEILFLMGPWIVVPLGAHLFLAPDDRLSYTLLAWTIFPAAALATISFFVADRVLAACLAGVWFLVCAAIALDGAQRLVRSRGKSFVQFSFAAGEAYLAVAGLWLVASRAGVPFMGFREPIVLLTAVHFSFAGFASAVLAGLTYERVRESQARGLLQVAFLAAVCGPGILGLAFLAGPKWKLFAALLIAVGQLGLATAMMSVAVKAASGLGRWLLLIAGSSVVIGMMLAAFWAIGEYPLQPFVDIRQMAEFHGVLNGVGFVLCGLVGWAVIVRGEIPSAFEAA